MINMDQRAQISVEYILLVAVVFLIVIVFAVIITNQNEQNNVATAAQLGATNATANLIFTNTGQSPVKVTSVTMKNVTQINNISNINITIHFSRSVADQQAIIFNSIANSLNTTLNTTTNYTIVQNSNSLVLTTNKYKYTIMLG